MGIKVLLVDDHKIVREGLRVLVEMEPDLEVVAEADNGRTAIHYAREQEPDVAVMDLNMPEMGGLDAIRHLKALVPVMQTLVLSMESEQPYVVEALKAGAKGYLVKDCAAEELVQAIRAVAAGDTYLSPKMTQLIINDYMQRVPEEAVPKHPLLSKREQEVLQLIADGKSNKEIAFVFGVSAKTVEAQRLNIMKKLNLHTIAELTKYAIRHGLTSIG